MLAVEREEEAQLQVAQEVVLTVLLAAHQQMHRQILAAVEQGIIHSAITVLTAVQASL
tara:strand:+ start:996 stop:1169 length:174 start_codon:yes stop_codon:yes gene_type:complete